MGQGPYNRIEQANWKWDSRTGSWYQAPIPRYNQTPRPPNTPPAKSCPINFFQPGETERVAKALKGIPK